MLAALVLALATGPMPAQDAVPVTPGGAAASTGSIWPPLAGDGLRTLDGTVLGLEDLDGRWVLLDFWATWCAPCIAELPTLRTLADQHADDRLLVLGVSMNHSPRGTVKAWLQRQQIRWPQIHDGRGFDGRLPRAFGVEALPRTVLVNPHGRIVAVDLRGAELIGTIAALIVGDDPAASRQ